MHHLVGNLMISLLINRLLLIVIVYAIYGIARAEHVKSCFWFMFYALKECANSR